MRALHRPRPPSPSPPARLKLLSSRAHRFCIDALVPTENCHLKERRGAESGLGGGRREGGSSNVNYCVGTTLNMLNQLNTFLDAVTL